jgi:four helix bundle protein
MTYERIEHLPMWRAAADLYDAAVDLLEHRGLRASPAFRDQLERAALSASNNIAEGFERGTTNELLAFLYIARGSAGEVRSMLRLLLRRLSRLQANPGGAEQGAPGQGGVDQTPPEQSPCIGPAVALKPEGRKAFFRAYEQRMDTLVTHPLFNYRVNYRRVLEIQTRLLARYLTGEIPRYHAFVTR